MDCPQYQLQCDSPHQSTEERIANDAQWTAKYLSDDVNALQMLKQHHVHLLDEETQEREPLQGCKRKNNPKLCKANFPRTQWLIEKTVVVCQGLACEMDMAISGKRSKLTPTINHVQAIL